jgi:hypothetical protein
MSGKRPYLPPFTVIRGLFGRKRDAPPIADDEPVTIPFGILRALLRGTLVSVPFQEERYLHLNPDVAAAVFRGEIRSGHEHFVTNGYFEGRHGAGEDFVEAWYLDAYPDVAMAIRAGAFASAHEHYTRVGLFELRGPNPRAEEELATWRACGAATPAATGDGTTSVTPEI